MAKDKEEIENLKVSAKLTRDRLNKKFANCIIKPGQKLNIKRISSGNDELDEILDGGYPVGRLTQIWGPPKAGKTTLIYNAIAATQKTYPNLPVLMVDAERHFDPERAVINGVNLDMLDLCQPDNADQAFEVMRAYLNTDIKMLALDSVPFCMPKKVMENGIGETEVAPIARFMSIEIPKIKPFIEKSDCAVIFVNQLRESIGVFGLGETAHPPGGKTLLHETSLLIRIQRKGSIKKSDEEVGQECKVKIDNSKVCTPKREVMLNLIYKRGFVKPDDLERVKTEVRKETLDRKKTLSERIVDSADAYDDEGSSDE